MEEEKNKKNIFVGFSHQFQNQNQEQDLNQKHHLRKCIKGKTINNSLTKSYYCQQEFILSEIPLLQKCKSTQEDCFKNVTKQELRLTIYSYLKKLIDSSEFREEQIKNLDFSNLTKSLYVDSPTLKNNNSYLHTYKLNNSFLRSTILKPLPHLRTMSKSISIQEHCHQKKYIQTLTLSNGSQGQSHSKQQIGFIIFQQRECQSEKYTQEIQPNASACMNVDNVDKVDNVSIIISEVNSNNKKQQKGIQTSIVLQKSHLSNQNKSKKDDETFSEIKLQIYSSDLFSPQRSEYSNESSKFELLLNDQKFQFNEQFIGYVFDEPDPFLMNLSLCLMMKFLYCSQIELNSKTICPILGISTMISYKLFEDLPMQGLLQFFSLVLDTSQQQLKMMQRKFLNQIKYETIISNEQYHQMLAMILKQQKVK